MPRKMRDSGIAWIGAVPEEWKVNTLSQVASQVKCKNEGLKEQNLLSLSYGKIKRKSIDTVGGLLPASFDGYNIIEPDDIVLRLTDLQNDQHSLRVGLSHEKGIITSAYTTIRPVNSANFLFYSLYAFDISKGFYGMGSGVRQGLNYDEVRDLKIALPPLPEQRAIAEYLDRQCAAIDAAVEEAKKGIEEYKAWKKSLVFEVVTGKRTVQSLEFRVQSARRMRDSGVAWIGQVPEGWTFERLRYLAKISTGDHDTQDADPDGEYPFYVRSPIIERSKDYTFEGVGILMAGDGAGAGRVFHLADGKYAVHQRVYRMYDFKMCYPRFLWRYLSAIFPQVMDMGSAQSTVPSVRMPMLLDLRVCLPPLPEQRAIADYLDEKCAAIDAMVAEKEKLIADLESYKKSLIFECVTGKRPVPMDGEVA